MKKWISLCVIVSLFSAWSNAGKLINLPASGGGSGTVTGVTGTAPIVSSGGTAPIISCIVATGSVAGCLSAADWTTFNGKQAAGNYITALTGDVTASGPGSVAATVALVAGSTAANVHAAELLANAATDANTSGAIVKRNSGNFSAGTITAALTGAASSNVLKAGDTMTGALINNVAGALSTPAVLISGAPVTGGSATTTKPQLNVDSGASSNAWSTSGTVIGGNSPSGFTGNLIDLQLNASRRLSMSAAGALTLGNSNNTRQMAFDYTNTNTFYIGKVGTNATVAIFDTNTGGAGANWIAIAADGPQSVFWPQSFQYRSATGTITALSSFLPSLGASVNSLPCLTMYSQTTAANGLVGFLTASGGTQRQSGFFGVRAVDVTPNAEVSEAIIANMDAGTLTEHLRIKDKGQIVTLGQAPAAGTCGTSPGTPTGNDNFFKITSGTGGSSGTCSVTLKSTPLTAGNCSCRDKTTVSTVVDADVSGSTVTMTTYSRTTGVAVNFAASDVFECQCQYF